MNTITIFGQERATANFVEALRADPKWADLRKRCARLHRPIYERVTITRQVLAVFPSLTPLLAGDVAHEAMNELAA